MMTKFEAGSGRAFGARQCVSVRPEQKNIVKAEFLRGAATAFALCWRGEESTQCLEAAKALDDQLKCLTRAARPASSTDTIECDNPSLVRRSRRKP